MPPGRRPLILALAFSSTLVLAGHGCGRTRPSGTEVWLAPNLGSPDTIDMFGQPKLWTAARRSTDVFKFYEQQILADRAADCPACRRNIYPDIAPPAQPL